MPTIMMMPMKLLTESLVPVTIEHQEDARDAERHAEHDDQRIDQRFELRREHHVDERERHQRREDEPAERLLLLGGLARRAARVKPSGGWHLVERPPAWPRSPRRGPSRARRWP